MPRFHPATAIKKKEKRNRYINPVAVEVCILCSYVRSGQALLYHVHRGAIKTGNEPSYYCDAYYKKTRKLENVTTTTEQHILMFCNESNEKDFRCSTTI